VTYTKEQRESLSREAAGKVIKSLEWSAEPDGSDGYWVMTFDDDSEISFRLMVELVEIDRLKKAVLNKQGDELCWFSDPEKAKILPEGEFLESCRRYHQQLSGERGVFTEGRTIAQLEEENARLRERIDG
jgi:hypothetical protein